MQIDILQVSTPNRPNFCTFPVTSLSTLIPHKWSQHAFGSFFSIPASAILLVLEMAYLRRTCMKVQNVSSSSVHISNYDYSDCSFLDKEGQTVHVQYGGMIPAVKRSRQLVQNMRGLTGSNARVFGVVVVYLARNRSKSNAFVLCNIPLNCHFIRQIVSRYEAAFLNLNPCGAKRRNLPGFHDTLVPDRRVKMGLSNPEGHTQENQPENEGQQPATQEETSTKQPQEASATDCGGASRTGINTVNCQTFMNHKQCRDNSATNKSFQSTPIQSSSATRP